MSHKAQAGFPSRRWAVLIAAVAPIALMPKVMAEPNGLGEIRLNEHPIEIPRERAPVNDRAAPTSAEPIREGAPASQLGNIEGDKAPKPPQMETGSLPPSNAAPGRPKTLTRTNAVKDGLSDMASKPDVAAKPNPSNSQYDKIPGTPSEYGTNAKPASATEYGSAPPERTNAKPATTNVYDKLPAQSQYGSGPPERTNATRATNQYDKLPAQSQYGSGPPERMKPMSAAGQYDKLPAPSQYGAGPPERTNATSATNQYDKLPAKSQYDLAPKPKQ